MRTLRISLPSRWFLLTSKLLAATSASILQAGHMTAPTIKPPLQYKP